VPDVLVAVHAETAEWLVLDERQRRSEIGSWVALVESVACLTGDPNRLLS